jgi:hypothetical protein
MLSRDALSQDGENFGQVSSYSRTINIFPNSNDKKIINGEKNALPEDGEHFGQVFL